MKSAIYGSFSSTHRRDWRYDRKTKIEIICFVVMIFTSVAMMGFVIASVSGMAIDMTWIR